MYGLFQSRNHSTFQMHRPKKSLKNLKSLISKLFHLLFSLWQIQYTHRSNWPKQAALWTKAEWGAATGFSPSRLNVQGQQHSLPAASNTMSPMPEAAAVFGLRRHCIVPDGYLGNDTVLKVLLRTWNIRINVRKGAKAIRTTNIIGGRIIPACYHQQKHFFEIQKACAPKWGTGYFNKKYCSTG